MKRIARVFPRRTKATPDDELAFTGPPDLYTPEVDEVHVSVTFTYDIPRAKKLAESWGDFAPVKMGGPAIPETDKDGNVLNEYGTRGGDFTPGMYMKDGYVMTSRGCPNKCDFCMVPKREGKLRELKVQSGWNICDDNILACSNEHFEETCEMLKRDRKKWGRPAEFTGGLEARRLTQHHAEVLKTATLDGVDVYTVVSCHQHERID